MRNRKSEIQYSDLEAGSVDARANNAPASYSACAHGKSETAMVNQPFLSERFQMRQRLHEQIKPDAIIPI